MHPKSGHSTNIHKLIQQIIFDIRIFTDKYRIFTTQSLILTHYLKSCMPRLIELECNIHKPISNIHEPISIVHEPISNIDAYFKSFMSRLIELDCNIHEPKSNIHEPISNIHEPISNIHEPILIELECNIHKPISNIHEPISYFGHDSFMCVM